jgi:hypothetical protein
MTLLEQVAWPAVLGQLIDQPTRRAMVGHAVAIAHDPTTGIGHHGLFAELVQRTDTGTVAEAVAGASDLDGDQLDRVVRWLIDAAVLFGRLGDESDEPEPSDPVEDPAPTGTLMVAPTLAPWLPGWLLELAADVAAERGGLTISEQPLRDALAGYWDPTAGRIVVDLAKLGPADLGAAVAHELAHALDPRLGQVGAAAEEAFAHAGAAVLLEERPTTVALARVLLTELDQVRSPSTIDPDLPTPGVSSLVAFSLLPVTGSHPLAGRPSSSLVGQGRPAPTDGGGRQPPVHVTEEGRPAGVQPVQHPPEMRADLAALTPTVAAFTATDAEPLKEA